MFSGGAVDKDAHDSTLIQPDALFSMIVASGGLETSYRDGRHGMKGCATASSLNFSKTHKGFSPAEILEVIREDQDRLDRMMDELWEKVNDWHETLS